MYTGVIACYAVVIMWPYLTDTGLVVIIRSGINIFNAERGHTIRHYFTALLFVIHTQAHKVNSNGGMKHQCIHNFDY